MHLRLHLQTVFQSLWSGGLRCIHATRTCWLFLKDLGSGSTLMNAGCGEMCAAARRSARGGKAWREVLQGAEGKDFDQASIFMVPLEMLPNTGRDIAWNFSLQQEAVHLSAKLSTMHFEPSCVMCGSSAKGHRSSPLGISTLHH